MDTSILDKAIVFAVKAHAGTARRGKTFPYIVHPMEAVEIVALGDKLSNARIIYRDFVQKGDELWKIFHVTDVKEHEWHYRGLVTALKDLKGTFAYSEFEELVDKIFAHPKNS